MALKLITSHFFYWSRSGWVYRKKWGFDSGYL